MSTTPSPDTELTEAYVRLVGHLRAHLRRRGFEASVASDVVQEVFLEAPEQKKSGKTISNIHGWLFSAVRNAAIDGLRATRRTESLDEDIAIDVPDDDIETHADIHDLKKMSSVYKSPEEADVNPVYMRTI